MARGGVAIVETPAPGAGRGEGADVHDGIEPVHARSTAADEERHTVEGFHVARLLLTHDGPVAVAIGVPRCDAVDDVVRAADEAVVERPRVEPLAALVRAELGVLNPRVSYVEPRRGWFARTNDEAGQSTVMLSAVVAVVLAVAGALALVASALGRTADVQGRVDVAALAGVRELQQQGPRRYDADPSRRIELGELRARTRTAAVSTARANGLRVRDLAFVDADGRPIAPGDLPTRLRVRAVAVDADGQGRRVISSTAEVVVASMPAAPVTGQGDYTGPLAVRQGQRMRPDVARAFDRLAAAARRAGHALVVVSGYRSDREQAELFRRHPDPKWVAPPGRSLHRLGTELDLGPDAAYGWLAANGERFGFRKRYSWEPWHFGYVRSAGSASVGYRAPVRTTALGGERATSAVPSFVPARYVATISRAAQRWNVGAALLGAQLAQESGFDPRAVSPAGAAGIAQFMPATGATYGLTPAERFDPDKAIDAQAHLMHDLLRQFGSVPLALAAYNAGPGNVRGCMCVPAIPETQAYVQAILAPPSRAGVGAAAGLSIRLVA